MNKNEETIKWLINHPLWTYPLKLPCPPSIEEMFTKNEDGTFTIIDDRSNWELIEVGGGGFREAVDIEYVFVNPATNEIDINDSLNSCFKIWIEAGGWYDQSSDKSFGDIEWTDKNKWVSCIDYRLSCEGLSIEDAFIALAELVKAYYHEDGTSRDLEK